jgi:hypothetical protein
MVPKQHLEQQQHDNDHQHCDGHGPPGEQWTQLTYDWIRSREYETEYTVIALTFSDEYAHKQEDNVDIDHSDQQARN